MSHSQSKPVASAQRPLPLRARADLVITTVSYRGEQVWIVKDPLSLDYYRLQARQYALLKLLDGEQSCDSLRASLTEQFPGFRPTNQQIRQWVRDLFEKRLIWSTRPGQHEVLAERVREKRWQRCLSAARNILFIRLPGWDPHRLLERIYPRFNWLFHPAMLFITMSLLIASWGQIFLHFDEFQKRVPAPESFISWQTMLILWGTLSICKILHELGHALACRHYGGECHEIGLAFLIFSPCLYCDVSDSWMLRSRRQRIAIAAGGMYIESLLAASALFLWWNTQAGVLHQISFAVFLISNISTLLFNLNPLLRLDGYYILCDLLEVPNLRSKSDQVLKRCWSHWFLGIQLPGGENLSSVSSGWLGFYGVLSLIYRWCLAFAICLTLYQMLKPYGLEGLGLSLGVATMIISLIAMLHQLVQVLRNHREQWANSRKPAMSVILLAGIIIAALFVPIPWYISVPMVLEPHQAEKVYIDSPGRLIAIHVLPGQTVKKGDLLLELQNPELSLQVLQLQSAVAVQQIEWKVRLATGDIGQAEVARQSYQALQKELQARQQLEARLKIVAPCDGMVIAPPARPEMPESDTNRKLTRWSGTLLERKNLGCYLPTRIHAMTISPQGQFASIMLIDQFHRTDFKIGQQVTIRLDSANQPAVTSQIDEISPVTYSSGEEQQDSLSELVNYESFTNPMNVQSAYQAVSLLPASELPLLTGMRGHANVLVARHTAWEWSWRYLRATFNVIL